MRIARCRAGEGSIVARPTITWPVVVPANRPSRATPSGAETQMRLAQWDEPIQTLASDREYEPFRIRVQVRTARRQSEHLQIPRHLVHPEPVWAPRDARDSTRRLATDRLVRLQICFVKPSFHSHEDLDSSTVFLDPLSAPDGVLSGDEPCRLESSRDAESRHSDSTLNFATCPRAPIGRSASHQTGDRRDEQRSP